MKRNNFFPDNYFWEMFNFLFKTQLAKGDITVIKLILLPKIST